MTTVYKTFIHLDSIDPDIDDAAGAGVLNVKLIEPVPVIRHSSLFVSVYALNIPVPNQTGVFVPDTIRIKCSTPTTAQDDSGYNGVLLQLYPAMHMVSIPGDFSVISYRDAYNTGPGVQLLDPYLAFLRLYLVDGSDNPYVPQRPFDIVLKVEVIRNYQAEILEQINKLVVGQRLLLLKAGLTNPINDSAEEQETDHLAATDIYGPYQQEA